MNVNEFFDVNLNHNGTVNVNQVATNESGATEVCKFPEQHEKDISKEINFLRFSCWFKLLRISAQVFIAVYLLCSAKFLIYRGPERMYAFNDQPQPLQILLLPRTLWSMKKKHLGKAVKVC